jgi:hypothetical protein
MCTTTPVILSSVLSFRFPLKTIIGCRLP